MELKTCIITRRSSRSFKSKDIPNDILVEILNSAQYAPSPKNRQPWRFLVLYGEAKEKIVEHYKNQAVQCSENDYLMKNEIGSSNDSFNIIGQAPVLILVFNAFPSKNVFSSRNIDFDLMNTQAIGAAIEHVLLRATDFGIGSLWVGDILSEREYIYSLYPNIGELIAGIVLGYSNKLEEGFCRPAFKKTIFDYKEFTNE